MPVAVTARLAAARVLPCTSTVAFWPLARLVSWPARKSWTGASTGADCAGPWTAGTSVAAATRAAARKRTGRRMWDLPRRSVRTTESLNGERAPSGHAPPRTSGPNLGARPARSRLGCGHGLPGARIAPPTDAAAVRAELESDARRDAEVVGRAPGRVNLIGEHTDYNGGPGASRWRSPTRRTPPWRRATTAGSGSRSRQEDGVVGGPRRRRRARARSPGGRRTSSGVLWALRRGRRRRARRRHRGRQHACRSVPGCPARRPSSARSAWRVAVAARPAARRRRSPRAGGGVHAGRVRGRRRADRRHGPDGRRCSPRRARRCSSTSTTTRPARCRSDSRTPGWPCW